MKFQNCILINFVTDARTDARTDKAKAICPFNFSKVGGIKTCDVTYLSEISLPQEFQQGRSCPTVCCVAV